MRLSVPPNASDLARSGSVSSEASAKSVRTRSGLFGFFRPQKTVSPLTQQATQDLPVAKFRTHPQNLRTEDEGQDSGIPAESGSAWSTLPEHLIESVMEMLQTEIPPPMHHSNKTSRQVCRLLLQSVAHHKRLHLKPAFYLRVPLNLGRTTHCNNSMSCSLQTQFAVTSVSKNWRQIGRRAFFKGLWDSSGAITHPVQLFGLVRALCRDAVRCLLTFPSVAVTSQFATPALCLLCCVDPQNKVQSSMFSQHCHTRYNSIGNMPTRKLRKTQYS